MASSVEWSHDFCLSCDRQIAEGAYCSQACRLADLEKAGSHEPTTPSNLSSSASSTSSSTHGFYLPPAVNFSAFKTASSSSRGFDMGPSTPHYYAAANASYFAPTAASSTSTQQHQRSLTPSSSRSSLASAAASQSSSGISPQAANQLSGYMRSFEHAKDSKRRYKYY